MNIRIQVVVAIIVIAALLVIVNMIRRKRLELRYALVWLGVGIGTLFLDCFPIVITKISQAMGIANRINMLFFFGFCFSLAIIFVLTVAISRMSIRIKQLSQEIALFEEETNKKKENIEYGDEKKKMNRK